MKPFKPHVDPDCPKDTIYLVDEWAYGTLAKHPKITLALSKGQKVLVSNGMDAKRLEEVEAAMQRVGRIDL